MNFIRSIQVVDAHTAGEPTRIVVGGIPKIPGDTMAEKKSFLLGNLDHIRKALMHEPRGHRDMFGSFLTQPCSEEADVGIIFMDTGGYLNMCGHGTIGAVTVAVETGMVPISEPETKVVLESPAGMVYARAQVEGAKVKSVTVQNVPGFLYKRDLKLDVPGVGPVTVDIAFGGNFFALVNAHDLGLEVCPANAPELIRKGIAIKDYINETIEIQHPEKTHITSVDLTEIYQDDNLRPGSSSKNIVVFGANQFDRSPCGTGTSARMAALYAKGKLMLDEEFVYESVIGTTFRGRVIRDTKIGDMDAVIPQITGSAYIVGFQQFVIDPDDPVKYGFLVG